MGVICHTQSAVLDQNCRRQGPAPLSGSNSALIVAAFAFAHLCGPSNGLDAQDRDSASGPGQSRRPSPVPAGTSVTPPSQTVTTRSVVNPTGVAHSSKALVSACERFNASVPRNRSGTPFFAMIAGQFDFNKNPIDTRHGATLFVSAEQSGGFGRLYISTPLNTITNVIYKPGIWVTGDRVPHTAPLVPQEVIAQTADSGEIPLWTGKKEPLAEAFRQMSIVAETPLSPIAPR